MEKSLSEDTMQGWFFLKRCLATDVLLHMLASISQVSQLQILEEETILYFLCFGEISVNVKGKPGAGVLHCYPTLSAKA